MVYIQAVSVLPGVYALVYIQRKVSLPVDRIVIGFHLTWFLVVYFGYTGVSPESGVLVWFCVCVSVKGLFCVFLQYCYFG